MKNLIKFHTDSSININRLAELLNENNIPSMIKDQNASGRMAGFGVLDNTVDLFIEKSDLTNAQKVAEAFQSNY